MAHIRPLDLTDLPALYPIAREELPFCSDMTFEQFRAKNHTVSMTILKDARPIGEISLTEVVPELDALLHTYVSTTEQSRWLNRRILHDLGLWWFTIFRLRRVSAMSIVGYTYRAAKLLEAIGFKFEGIKRQAGVTSWGRYHDIATYGLLPEEYKWYRPVGSEDKDL